MEEMPCLWDKCPVAMKAYVMAKKEEVSLQARQPEALSAPPDTPEVATGLLRSGGGRKREDAQ